MQTVVQRANDPFIYLFVMGEWYCYNPFDNNELLGSGAMGDVYRGYRCANGMSIAVKRVKDEYANNKMIRDRARQEASLAFRHPNLVEMIGICEYAPDYGPIFILSHYVQGMNIDKYVSNFAQDPFRVEKISNAICSVLEALDYIHSRGVIHRDIKPSNIMVENGSNVRLMDLGISRMSGGNKFSSYGFIGTPEYSAPEQVSRKENSQDNPPINATSDIYSLGLTFYELLTGKNPMKSDSEATTLSNQISKPLPPHPAIPHQLMRVITKATQKNQEKRYQTADEFKKAIKKSFESPPSPTVRITSWIQQNAVLFISICTCVALAFIILIILAIQ